MCVYIYMKYEHTRLYTYITSYITNAYIHVHVYVCVCVLCARAHMGEYCAGGGGCNAFVFLCRIFDPSLARSLARSVSSS